MKRIMLKLSGEALGDKSGRGIDASTTISICDQVKEIVASGKEVAVVIGGGNIFRGVSGEKAGYDRVSGDFMGMLATIMNAVAMQNIFEDNGLKSMVMTPFRLEEYVELFNVKKALDFMKNGGVVICAGGTGRPFFTTDTAAALRSAELGIDLLIKATKVNGVYDSDPEINKNAKLFSEIEYKDILKDGLKVMDTAAIAICMDNSIPIRVLNIFEKGNILKLVNGQQIGTLIK
ncbi:MAG: UMP kinase [Candidatus Cloacimonadota bacterium]|nr:MAG: UMP kinase [Candidatus Cloacimonadota bacterium]